MKKNLTGSIIKAAVFVFVTGLSVVLLINIGRVHSTLILIPGQLDKIVDSEDLYRDLIIQSNCIEGYILYQNPDYLEKFRIYTQKNRDQLDRLYPVVRQSRKPMLEAILRLWREYVSICEEEIVPLVMAGDTAGAVRIARSSKVLSIQQEMTGLAESFEEMRIDDTGEMLEQTIRQAERSLLWAIWWALFLLLGGLGAGIAVNRKIAMENLIYRLILLNTRNAVMVIRWDGRIHTVNRAAEKMFGFTRKGVVGKNYGRVFTGRQAPGEVAYILQVKNVLENGTETHNTESEYIDAGGLRRTMLVDCLRLSDESGVLEGVMVIIRDITERKLIEEKLRGMAVRDGLTGLYNHSYIKQSLENEIKQSMTGGHKLAFMIIDLDDFKKYNDILGHPAGDDLLKTMAALLENKLRVSDIVGRYGGDEFTVILPRADHATAVEVGERLRRAVSEYSFPCLELMPSGKVTISLGISCYPDDAADSAALIEMADQALYNAKRNAKDRVEVYFSAFKEVQYEWPHGPDVLYNIKGLLAIVNSKDRYTYGHSEKVADYAAALALTYGLDHEEVRNIKVASFLHDIGKVDIPEELLNKPGPLNAEEYRLIKRHPETGAGIVGQIRSLEKIVPLVLYHHERYDGRGYPRGLKGDKIPLAARMIALADSFDAMISHRPYRRAMSVVEALEKIKRGSGRQFDPVLAELFVQMHEKGSNGFGEGLKSTAGE